MSASCRRPGCTKVAAVTIHYDPVSCQLWLDPITVADRAAQVLCAEHAERLSPPRGWVVVDRRGSQTTIRSTGAETIAASPPPRASRGAARRRWGSFEEPTLDFTAAVESASTAPESPAVPESTPIPELAPILVEEPPESTQVGESQVGESREEMEQLLSPRGGLLGRAFEATGHQRSALTILEESSE